jgi:predicted metal-dependent peptidase
LSIPFSLKILTFHEIYGILYIMARMKKSERLTKEQISKLRDTYINNDISLAELCDLSIDVMGRQVSIDELKNISVYDPEGKWSILRANKGRKTSDVPYSEKLNVVANKLYELLIDDDSSLPGTSVAQVAKTWMEIVTKTDLSKINSTAKTSVQRAKDIFEEMEARSRELRNSS